MEGEMIKDGVRWEGGRCVRVEGGGWEYGMLPSSIYGKLTQVVTFHPNWVVLQGSIVFPLRVVCS